MQHARLPQPCRRRSQRPGAAQAGVRMPHRARMALRQMRKVPQFGYGSPSGKRVRGNNRPEFESPTFRVGSANKARKKGLKWDRYYRRTVRPLLGENSPISSAEVRIWVRCGDARMHNLRRLQKKILASLPPLSGEELDDSPWGSAFKSLADIENHLREMARESGKRHGDASR